MAKLNQFQTLPLLRGVLSMRRCLTPSPMLQHENRILDNCCFPNHQEEITNPRNHLQLRISVEACRGVILSLNF